MSKYNLTDILNEYIGGGRIGTLRISYKDLVDKMDELEKSNKVIVREKGSSADGKVNREFEVVDRNSPNLGINKQERGFTVYDYKFGFDPADEDNFTEEYDFSVGGNDLQLAMDLIDGVKAYGIGDFPNLKEDEFEEARQKAIESSQEAAGIKENIPPSREDNVIKDLVKADEVIKMIKMMNPDVREDLLKRIARMGQKLNEGDLFSSKFDRQELKAIINDLNKGLILDMPTRRAYKFLVSLLDKEDKEEMGLNEQMYIDDDEFNKEMGRSKKDSLKLEIMFHVNQLLDGNIDMNDFMNVIEEIMAEVKSLKEEMGLNESIPALEKMNNLINALRFHYMQLEKGNIDKDDFINAVEELAFGERRAPGMKEVMNIDRKGKKKSDKKSNLTGGAVTTMKEEIAPTGIGISGDQLKNLIKLGAIAGVEVFVRDKDGKNVRKVDYTLTNTDFEKDPERIDVDYIDENEGQEALKEHFNRFMFKKYS